MNQGRIPKGMKAGWRSEGLLKATYRTATALLRGGHARQYAGRYPNAAECPLRAGWNLRAFATYHRHVRRLFVFLMIVLLPLRAWAGDAMGVQMAASSAAVHVAGAMPADCPMLLAGLSAALSAAESAPDAKMVHPPGGMESCSSCELCVPLADLAPARFDVVGFSGHEQPLMGGVDFFSASPAPTFKPPIS